MADNAAGLTWRISIGRIRPVAATIRAVAGLRSWLAAVPMLAVDAAIAAVVFVWFATTLVALEDGLTGRLPVAIALAAVITGSLAWRRKAPLAGYVVGTVALAVEALWVLADPLTPYANLIGLYSLGMYGLRRQALWGPVVALLGVLAYFAKIPAPSSLPAGVLFLWLLAWASGYAGARRRERQEVARRLLRRSAIDEERARMARELHDLIGHTVSVMLVQAGASRLVLDSDPGKARELLAGVERTGREALDELDRVLGVLRSAGPDRLGGTAELDVRPGLAELDRLARRMAEAGMRVRTRVGPTVGELPRSLDLSVYRIVQEALTNALRHGRASAATVSVDCSGSRIEVLVCDDGAGPQPGFQPGRGLLGIAERVAAFAGVVEYGAGEQGGFRLWAALPR